MSDEDLAKYWCNSPVYDDRDVEDMEVIGGKHFHSNAAVPIDTAFQRVSQQGATPREVALTSPMKRGSYHMYHRVDGRLAAVGVLDLLDHTLVSLQFAYDPDFRHLNLGTVGAIVELEFMRKLRA